MYSKPSTLPAAGHYQFLQPDSKTYPVCSVQGQHRQETLRSGPYANTHAEKSIISTHIHPLLERHVRGVNQKTSANVPTHAHPHADNFYTLLFLHADFRIFQLLLVHK